MELTENQKRDQQVDAMVRKSLGINRSGSQIGIAPNNEKAHRAGLDDIDREAMKQGAAMGRIGGMVPRRHHIRS